MNKISDWTAENRMVLNASKTKTLLVTGKRLKSELLRKDIKVSINSSDIEKVSCHKLLGVKLDKHLNFNEHVDDLCKKLFQRIGVIRKIKCNLPLEQRKLYYNALI